MVSDQPNLVAKVGLLTRFMSEGKEQPILKYLCQLLCSVLYDE